MNELTLTSAARPGSDPDTGASVLRWTESDAKDQHLYFTSPSVTSDNRWLVILSERTGRIEQEAEVPFWVTHVQFSPTDPTRLIFNQEGNSGRSISQRIWKWDLDRDHVLPLHPQLSYEWLAHENFSPDGGCIVSHGGRRDGSERWVEHRAWSGKLVQRIAAGGIGGHAIPGTDGRTILLDPQSGEVWAWDIESDAPTLLCRHDSSYTSQDVHPHPMMTPDGRGVVFTSDKDSARDVGNVYECRLPEPEANAQ